MDVDTSRSSTIIAALLSSGLNLKLINATNEDHPVFTITQLDKTLKIRIPSPCFYGDGRLHSGVLSEFAKELDRFFAISNTAKYDERHIQPLPFIGHHEKGDQEEKD